MCLTYPDKFTYLNTSEIELTQRGVDNGGSFALVKHYKIQKCFFFSQHAMKFSKILIFYKQNWKMYKLN